MAFGLSRGTFRVRRGDGSHFGLRLGLTLIGSLAVLAVVTYVLVSHELYRAQVRTYSQEQQSDAAWFAALGAGQRSRSVTLREVGDVLSAVSHRPGVLEAILVDRRHVVRAAGDVELIGTRDADPRLHDATLGQSFAGHESRAAYSDDFNFIAPVRLPWGTWAYEATYSASGFDRQLADIRETVALISLAGAIGVLLLFYLSGGKALLRSHRYALQRSTLDGLTDLPNRRAFDDDLERAVALAARHDEPVALALLDADSFKRINDRHGHQAGDAVLTRIAQLLGKQRLSDRAYRIGGDEFALLLPHTDRDGVRRLGQRLSRAFKIAGIEMSIGIASARGAIATDVLQAEADAALYGAKRRGGKQVVLYDDLDTPAEITSEEQKENLRRLLADGAVTTLWQPIWDLGTDTLLGLEALARPHAESGIAGPGEAFDLAERIGRVHDLDQICIARALETASELPAEALLFINLCPETLDQDANGNDWLPHLARRHGVAPEQIVIEVTERTNGHTPAVVKTLHRLQERGFKIALDDVGTGNSGLEMLRAVSPDYVKIDGSIVAAALTEPNARAVLLAMATYASETGAYVIAEHIEDQDTLDFVRSLHERRTRPIIQGGQGYELGRPDPPAVSIRETAFAGHQAAV